MSIKFSIAVPAYKGKFLEECILSILEQTYINFELIIVNDCSPDPVDAIVNSFVDERIYYYKNDRNIGAEHLVNNWNRCLELAKGDFFIMMGDDDKMEPYYLDEFLKLINKYNSLDVFHCRSKIIDENSQTFMLTPSWPEYESVYENIWHRVNGYRLQYISDFVFRTSVLKQNGGFYYLPLAWGSDDISSFIACGKKGIAHTNSAIFNYRKSRFTISSMGDQKVKMKAILLYKEWLNQFLKEVPEDELDKIIHLQLLSLIQKEFNRRKIEVIQNLLQRKIFLNYIKLFFQRKQLDITATDLNISLLKSFKKKLN